jgi:hypothetical protein
VVLALKHNKRWSACIVFTAAFPVLPLVWSHNLAPVKCWGDGARSLLRLLLLLLLLQTLVTLAAACNVFIQRLCGRCNRQHRFAFKFNNSTVLSLAKLAFQSGA